MATTPSLSPQRRPSSRAAVPVVVYGRRWCALSQMARRYLQRMGVPYEYVDLDLDPEAEARLRWLTGGRVHTPVVDIGGQMLVQPSIRELQWMLRGKGLLQWQS
jgi:mycoredoxin